MKIIIASCSFETKKIFLALVRNNTEVIARDSITSQNCEYSKDLLGNTIYFIDEKGEKFEPYYIARIRNKNSFESFDIVSMKRINDLFYFSKNSNSNSVMDYESSGIISRQWGHKTKKVYVFLPGLGLMNDYFLEQSSKIFETGYNVIVGHTNLFEKCENLLKLNQKCSLAGLWLQYAEYIGKLARHYGDEVVFVGQSLGGQLSVRVAEQGLADQIYLIQPLFDVSFYVEKILAASKQISSIVTKDTELLLTSGIQAQLLTKTNYIKINPKVKIKIYLSKTDLVVSNNATLNWIKEYAPQAGVQEVEYESKIKGHMKLPSSIVQDLIN